jgi:hypothetical protein
MGFISGSCPSHLHPALGALLHRTDAMDSGDSTMVFAYENPAQSGLFLLECFP